MFWMSDMAGTKADRSIEGREIQEKSRKSTDSR